MGCFAQQFQCWHLVFMLQHHVTIVSLGAWMYGACWCMSLGTRNVCRGMLDVLGSWAGPCACWTCTVRVRCVLGHMDVWHMSAHIPGHQGCTLGCIGCPGSLGWAMCMLDTHGTCLSYPWAHGHTACVSACPWEPGMHARVCQLSWAPGTHDAH